MSEGLPSISDEIYEHTKTRINKQILEFPSKVSDGPRSLRNDFTFMYAELGSWQIAASELKNYPFAEKTCMAIMKELLVRFTEDETFPGSRYTGNLALLNAFMNKIRENTSNNKEVTINYTNWITRSLRIDAYQMMELQLRYISYITNNMEFAKTLTSNRRVIDDL